MTAPTLPVTGLRSIGRALRHRNYRLFFSGQSISLVGTWLTRVAQGIQAATEPAPPPE